MPSNLWWGFWKDYPKVKLNGQEYAQIGDRLYAEHAVERFLPSGRRTIANIPVADQEGGGHMFHEKARSIPPFWVEQAIQRGIKEYIVVKTEPRTSTFLAIWKSSPPATITSSSRLGIGISLARRVLCPIPYQDLVPARIQVALHDPPEVIRQSEPLEHRLHFRRVLPLPSRLQSLWIPCPCQLPAHVQADECTTWQTAIIGPSSGVRFRPEGQDRRSRVRHVVPEPARRHHEVNDTGPARAPLLHR
ncbi:MAG TPA: hypothetical protein VE959_04625 [Bryobacteraceae bacterium]|nr:hypothetical protein [Bryobacteraceae bacterium]